MFVFDFHQDIAWKRINNVDSFFRKNCLWQKENKKFPNQVDLPRLEEVNVKLVFASSFDEKGDVKNIKKQIDFYRLLSQEYPDKFSLIKDFKDIKDVLENNKIGFLLHIEGLDFIKSEEDLKLIDEFFDLGVRSVGLTHNQENYLAGGALSKGKLKCLGRKLIEKCQKKGIIIDLAHLNKVSFSGVLKELSQPPLFSHGNVKSLFSHPRNLNDEQMKEIINRDGLIGISFVPRFLKENTLEQVYLNFKYILNLGGERNMAIGSDFDGMLGEELVKDLESVDKLKFLDKYLKEKKLSQKTREKIFFKNGFEFLEKILKN